MDKAQFTIFVVEDDEWYNRLLVHHLSLNPDYHVESFFNGKDLLAALHRQPDVISLDYKLPDMTGDTVLKRIKEVNDNIEVIIVSEQEEIETAVDLLKLGAYDYIVKSREIRERLLNTVRNLRNKLGLKQRISQLESEVEKKYDFSNTIIGTSEAMQKVFSLIEKAITTNITVTVTGETGTGKEVVAKTIHYNSGRRKQPFVAVNLAAIPSELFESELFGHEKGAFTGASYRRTGKFEEAHGGTLFLDEIGEMDINFQAKMLRALQDMEITRIGSNKPIKTDCRIIVATNRNLRQETEDGRFRKDLYYRLFGLPIELPPLRERGKDILVLARHFTERFCRDNNLAVKSFGEKALNKLMGYSWPGNVRELKSVVELAVVMATGDTVEAGDILLESESALPEVMSEHMTLREYNRKIVDIFMKKYNNNVPVVAEKLDIGQTTIYRMLKEKKQSQ